MVGPIVEAVGDWVTRERHAAMDDDRQLEKVRAAPFLYDALDESLKQNSKVTVPAPSDPVVDGVIVEEDPSMAALAADVEGEPEPSGNPAVRQEGGDVLLDLADGTTAKMEVRDYDTGEPLDSSHAGDGEKVWIPDGEPVVRVALEGVEELAAPGVTEGGHDLTPDVPGGGEERGRTLEARGDEGLPSEEDDGDAFMGELDEAFEDQALATRAMALKSVVEQFAEDVENGLGENRSPEQTTARLVAEDFSEALRRLIDDITDPGGLGGEPSDALACVSCGDVVKAGGREQKPYGVDDGGPECDECRHGGLGDDRDRCRAAGPNGGECEKEYMHDGPHRTHAEGPDGATNRIEWERVNPEDEEDTVRFDPDILDTVAMSSQIHGGPAYDGVFEGIGPSVSVEDIEDSLEDADVNADELVEELEGAADDGGDDFVRSDCVIPASDGMYVVLADGRVRKLAVETIGVGGHKPAHCVFSSPEEGRVGYSTSDEPPVEAIAEFEPAANAGSIEAVRKAYTEHVEGRDWPPEPPDEADDGDVAESVEDLLTDPEEAVRTTDDGEHAVGPGATNKKAELGLGPGSGGAEEYHALTDVPGVGHTKARDLRDGGFETVHDLRAASQSGIAETEGIGNALAARIKAAVGGLPNPEKTDEPDGDDGGIETEEGVRRIAREEIEKFAESLGDGLNGGGF